MGCVLFSDKFIGSFCGSGHGGVGLLLYRFQRVSRDISRGFNGEVALGGDDEPCRGGVAAELRSSLLRSFTYSTIRASNSEGAKPGTGPAKTINFKINYYFRELKKAFDIKCPNFSIKFYKIIVLQIQELLYYLSLLLFI